MRVPEDTKESISQQSVSSTQASKAYQGAKQVHTFMHKKSCEIISAAQSPIMDHITPPVVDAASLDADAFRRLYPEQYFQRFLDDDIRPDGRTLGRSRATNIGIGTITSVDGSALVKQGNTTVVRKSWAVVVERITGAMQMPCIAAGMAALVSAHSRMHHARSYLAAKCRHASTIQCTPPHLRSSPACARHSPVHPSLHRAAAPSP